LARAACEREACAGLAEPRDLAQLAVLAVARLAGGAAPLSAADLEAAAAEVAGSHQTLVRRPEENPSPLLGRRPPRLEPDAGSERGLGARLPGRAIANTFVLGRG
jgi:hypothetical protein